ncbi:hypothetical protein CFOL_v3_15716 [Cephalotus follicularis]|uniref:Retrotransposon gag domain-containing protein n=1 Tax=Cephalotus follicularis TaxID=3775 RepID=A0A1Q3BWJ8_CEPFO|nr:hypothetical protein CFOL_v3_15716 [Cephalotus follicularis]
MLGRRSLDAEVVTCDLEIEITLAGIRANNRMGENYDAPQRRPLIKHFTPRAYTTASCIRVPTVQAAQYEIKSSIIQMLPSFYGLANEEPYKHLDEFIETCSTFKIQNLSVDALKLILFPFSLKDRAKQWVHSLDSIIITT